MRVEEALYVMKEFRGGGERAARPVGGLSRRRTMSIRREPLRRNDGGWFH
ncbi:hypothetical protein COMA1_11302 [Candidatus Nitrospira nitrosa]|uniref:Uncharacterized protein n=1 Tax=Candidatus Nitrospira nitrosa TaxID=1742972 RepID=A0A0S4L7B9_9BACT|nr:hypothetical protein COMA1_11302 [Candidatus Nitrospira nitrosa]